MDAQPFDIFSGRPDHDPLWLETVAGRQNAHAAMEQRAAATPGAYFIFCTATGSVIAQIDTTPISASGAGAG